MILKKIYFCGFFEMSTLGTTFLYISICH